MNKTSKHEAHQQRVPFGPVKQVHWVTRHCLDRFRERTGVKGTVGQVLCRLEKWLEEARPAELKPGKVLVKMLNNGCKSANYYLLGNIEKGKGWILVVVGSTLTTIHLNQSGEWRLPHENNK